MSDVPKRDVKFYDHIFRYAGLALLLASCFAPFSASNCSYRYNGADYAGSTLLVFAVIGAAIAVGSWLADGGK